MSSEQCWRAAVICSSTLTSSTLLTGTCPGPPPLPLPPCALPIDPPSGKANAFLCMLRHPLLLQPVVTFLILVNFLICSDRSSSPFTNSPIFGRTEGGGGHSEYLQKFTQFGEHNDTTVPIQLTWANATIKHYECKYFHISQRSHIPGCDEYVGYLHICCPK